MISGTNSVFVTHLPWASLPAGLSPAAPVLGGAGTRPSASAAWTGPRADWRPEEEEEEEEEAEEEEDVTLKDRRQTRWRDKGPGTNQGVRRTRGKGSDRDP